jgi:signal transduction histidine kinase/CheY-like chemotaxis protein
MNKQTPQPAGPETSDLLAYGRHQRKRTLAVILLTILLATALFGLVNLLFYESQEPALVFFITSALCLPALWLNQRGYYLAAGTMAVILVLTAAHYNLADGAGLRDPGIVAYPIIIIFGGLLFGKRLIPLFTLTGIGSLLIVVYVQATFSADVDRLLIISILIVAAAVTTWAIMENMDKHLARIKESEIGLRQAYEQTQAQARQVRRIIETVPEGVLLLDGDGRVVLANQAAQEFLDVLAPLHDKNLPLSRLGDTALTEILETTGSGIWQEITIADPTYIFEVAARPVQREPAASRDWVLVLRNVTLQRKQQEALHEQERMATVGQLASGIAHDFRNILTVILTYSQILRVKPDTPKRYEYLTVIQEQSQHAAQLIEQVLDFGRRSVMERRATDVVDLVKELVSLLQRTMPANISIHFEPSPGKYVIRADKARLQQALMNLAVNARDAMPDGGRLHFALAPERPLADLTANLEAGLEAWVCLRVTDTGQGIAAVDLPRIFEPFYTRKEAGRGTGLGLAQVYGIVKQHDGEITVQSSEGEGTTFYLYFPAVTAEPLSPISRDSQPFTFEQEITILLVEDNPLTRESTEEMLKMLGCQVITAGNGQKALAIFQSQQRAIDLVISDIVMPEMGGIELFQRLQELAPHLKMLITTGYPLDEPAKKLLEQGAVEWVQKPYEVGEIARKISNALSRKK